MSEDPTVSNVEETYKPWQFKPGEVRNPAGRPKGTRNKLGEAFVKAMHADFEEHGAKVIETVRVEKPDQYLKVIASILPKELNVNTNALGDMSDDELVAVLSAMRSVADSFADTIARAGASEAEGTEPATALQPVH
jgi:hypothetical protein